MNEKLAKLTLKKPLLAKKQEPAVLTNMVERCATCEPPQVIRNKPLVTQANNAVPDEKLKDDVQSSSDNQSEETCKDEDEGPHQIAQNRNNKSGAQSNARNYIYNDSVDADDTFEDGDQPYAERKEAQRQQPFGAQTTNDRMRVIMTYHQSIEH